MVQLNPSKKVWKVFFALPFLMYSIDICKKYEVNHLISKITPTRLQSDDPWLSNFPEQADGSQSKSDKIATILDTLEH